MASVPTPGLDLIKTFEGLSLEAYPDPKTGNLPITIGWGSTRDKNGRPFKLGDRITREEADELLLEQIINTYLPPQQRIPAWKSLNDAQRGAILSFAYNLGANFYEANGFETLSRVLRNREWHNIEAALTMYRNPNSKVEEGLLRRRLTEANLFLSGTQGLSLSAAGQKYLAGGRTPSSNPNLSQEAQAYLANRPSFKEGSKEDEPTVDGPAPGSRLLFLTQPLLSGPDVQKLQADLVRWGAKITPDGVFGPSTKQAVELFQRSQGLGADGIVGPRTWIQLQKQPPAPVPQGRLLRLSSPYLSGSDVLALQQALARAGLSVAIDGVFGPTTDRAVRQFQANRGLVADGVVGAQTRTRLSI